MEPRFDRSRVERALAALDASRQAAFGAGCCERALPAYEAFLMRSSWGDLGPLRRAVEAAWHAAGGAWPGAEALRELGDACEACAPDLDEVDAPYASEALDATSAVCALVTFLENRAPASLAAVAEALVDAVDLVVQESEALDPADRELERLIHLHPLMQQELTRQARDLEEVKALAPGDPRALTSIRERARRESAFVRPDGKDLLT